MLTLTHSASYGLQATLQIAQARTDAPMPCGRIATAGNLPEQYLLQVLRNLVTNGVLRSTRGVDGGYMLARPPEEISVLEIIEAIDGPMDSRVPTGDGWSADAKSRLAQAIDGVVQDVRGQLEAIRLAQLITPKKRPRKAAASGRRSA